MIYSLKLYDTDSNEEVWAEDAAHHGVIYEARWSRDDRYLLTCSGDGTAKVWDLLPLLLRHESQQHADRDKSGRISRQFSSPSRHGIVHESNGSLQGLLTARSEPPSLLYTLVSTSSVFVYCGVFQEAASPAVAAALSTKLSSSMQGASLAASLDKFVDLERAAVPRIITGASDGRLRVWDNGKFAGFVVVRDKKDATKANPEGEDDSPHDGQVNSVVIDERSK